MKPKFALVIPLALSVLLSPKSYGQADTAKTSTSLDSSSVKTSNNRDSLGGTNREKAPGKDMGDVWHSIFRPHGSSADSASKALAATVAAGKKDTRAHLSFLPAAGYTLQTGFAGILSGNIAFNTDDAPNSKLSNISTNFTYSQ